MADNSSKKTITLDNLGTFLSCLKAEKGEPNGFASLDSEGKIPASQLSEDVADTSVTANEFSESTSYSVGDYVIYEGDLYVCIQDHTAGSWDNTHFTITNIADQLELKQDKTLGTPIVVEGTTYTTIESAVNAINEKSGSATSITNEFSENTSYTVGDYVVYEGDLYKCTTNHPAGVWNINHFTKTTINDEFMVKGRDYVTAGKKGGTTLGTGATAEGGNTEASGVYSHSEGQATKATALNSHSEGTSTQATATASHSEGQNTVASGISSHTEGEGTKASHQSSHSEGSHTQTGANYQHVQGKYNVGKSDTAFEIGNGTGNNARANALELSWEGDLTVSGDITDGNGKTLADAIDASQIGVPNGVAALDATGKVSASQLPSMSGGSGIKDFTAKVWTGLTEFEGKYVWSDGTNTYYSDLHTQYVLNKETSEWETTTWYLDNGSIFYFSGDNIWTDGDDIYYDTTSYILNKSTLAWKKNTWSGKKIYSVNKIWSDGNNTYYSEEGNNYVLNKQTSTWEDKTWYGLTNIDGASVWTDGDNIYVNDFENDYVLNKQTSTWEAKTWQGFSGVSGLGIWTDKSNIYYSNRTRQYILDRSSSTWISKTWKGLNDFYAEYIWTDGSDMYYSKDNAHYVLYSIGIDALLGQPDGIATLDSNGKVPSSQLTIGQANGIASLDSNGKVPASQLPTDTGLMIKKATFKIYSRGGSEYDTKDLIRELGDFMGELLYNYDSSTHKYGTRKAELMYITISDEMDEYKNHSNSNEYWFNPYNYNRYSTRVSSVESMLKNIKYTTVDSSRYGLSSRPAEVVYMYQSPLDKYDDNGDFVRLLQVRINLPDIGIRYSNGDINNNNINSIYSNENFISLSQLCYDNNTNNYVEIGIGNYISYQDIANNTSLYQTITVYYHDL